MDSNINQHIILDKELRRDIDAIIQRLKEGCRRSGEDNLTAEEAKLIQRPSRERSLAITKLQEAVMWLGMDLKAINDEGGSGVNTNRADNARNCIASIASILAEKRNSDDSTMHAGTTSFKSLERWADEALRALDSLNGNPYPNSKDPSNTKIDPTADGLKL